MNLLTDFILGYNFNILEVLVPVVNLSLMTILAVVFMLLARRTKDSVYLIVAITLEALSLYNIIAVAIIFLELYCVYPNIASNLYIFNNILLLFTILLMPLNNRSFLTVSRTINNLNNAILVISALMIIVLVAMSVSNFETFFKVNLIYGGSDNNYYRIDLEGLFYLYKMYIILFIFAATLFLTIIDISAKHNIGMNIAFIIFNLMGIYLIFADIISFQNNDYINFDRTGLSITLSYMIRFIATFSSFTINALNEINKDNILVNKLRSNLNILRNINGISEKLNIVDKDFMDSSMFVFEIDKENKDALDIMNSKVNVILESKDKLTETKENKNQIIKDGIKFTGTVFNFFEKYKNQLQDNCKLLNGIIGRIKETDFSHSELDNLKEDLKNIKNNLSHTSEKYINNIIEYSSQFKDISAITGEIYETIEYIKNITNKVSTGNFR